MHNSEMKDFLKTSTSAKYSFVGSVLFVASLSSAAQADVYIDLANTDEISISSAEPDLQYTLRITEPIPASIEPAAANIASETTNLPYDNEVMIAANQTSLAPALIHAVITVESKHNPRAQSNKGAYGLMQLMPATAYRFKVSDKRDPKQNILAGAKYLRELLTLFNGDLSLSLAAYNAGPAAVKKYRGKIPPYKETLDYVPKVLKYYRLYS